MEHSISTSESEFGEVGRRQRELEDCRSIATHVSQASLTRLDETVRAEKRDSKDSVGS